MTDWLKRLFKTPRPPAGSASQLALESQVQGLRLELSQAQETIQRLQKELERQRASGEALLSEKNQAQIAALLDELSAPVVQIVTLEALAQEKPVQSGDVLAVTRRLVNALCQAGLVLEGQIGEQQPYDPNRHSPLSAETALNVGQHIVIRLPGASFKGKLLQKAGVSARPEQTQP